MKEREREKERRDLVRNKMKKSPATFLFIPTVLSIHEIFHLIRFKRSRIY